MPDPEIDAEDGEVREPPGSASLVRLHEYNLHFVLLTKGFFQLLKISGMKNGRRTRMILAIARGTSQTETAVESEAG